MKRILSIIPARAGSKGIPNKNIRIVGGYPLIYYSINNARMSKYITDIVVTTDSPDIQTIATQVDGVKCHIRDKKLCADDITLDAVIYDAIPEGEWDYIVTMQPTSPTLRWETLDAAIEKAMESGVDTLISAVNRPHLSWRDSLDGLHKEPNYTTRLNRQYLPPEYFETGGFVISKYNVVTENSRIGDTVDIFEVPSDEAIDVDTFEDLLCVETILRKEKIAIYVNGNNTRGLGHVYRALELADEFYVKPDIFYDINQSERRVFGESTHNIIGVDGITQLFEICKKKQYTLFINDILNTSIDYMIGLRNVLPNAKVVNFEDEGEGLIKADLVINALLSETDYPHVYAGEKYYIASKAFMFYKPIRVREKVKRVFICFGGADPSNYADRLLAMISKEEYRNLEFVVALGKAKTNVSELMEYNSYENIDVMYDVKNMPEVMASCDIAISSRGRTAYELAILGIPTIVVSENEREKTHAFASNENGFTYIGMNPNDEIIESTLKMYIGLSQESRERFHNILLSHDLRDGRKHIMGLINGI